ncbi:MAG: hypothetical protein AAFQ98_01530 [Bacteroidota bacterium]
MHSKLKWLIVWGSTFLLLSCGNSAGNEPPAEEGPHVSNQETVLSGFIPVMRSLDHGLSWTPVGSFWPEGVQGSFLAEGSGHLLLATDNAGVFMAEGDYSTWSQIGTKLPSQKVNALHSNSQGIYVGLYWGGVYFSPNQGATWEPIAGVPDPRVHAILTTQDYLWVGTDVGLHRQDQRTQQWETLQSELQVTSLQHVGSTMIAGTHQGTLISEDEGNTWQATTVMEASHNSYLTLEGAYAMSINGEVHYNLFADSLPWQQAEYDPKDSSYVYEIVTTGPYLVMSNNHGLHRSVDLGKTWNRVYQPYKGVFFDLLDTPSGLYATLRR